jgi:hypothetical protein
MQSKLETEASPQESLTFPTFLNVHFITLSFSFH